ncbi:STM3941 family protein [Flavobacterium sp. 3HN19-14]|uniref:STM3941 family protein n=1 Tax=Flavobacterium sp. 3HN19-14 TaxID=3448133 RepID=UPI003EE276B8
MYTRRTCLYIFPEEFRRGSDVFKITIGIICVLFFGAILIASASELLLGRNVLKIDDKRIHYTVPFGKFTFEWKDIEAFSERNVMNNPFIVVHLKNEEAYLRNVSGIPGFFAKANARNFGTPFTITSKNFKISHTQLLDLLKDKLSEHLQNDGSLKYKELR